ncbi:MAG TPA: metallophosphoesterase family protein [Candidatus Acidoferrales bacterium]|nr:metallophosphoesterase family protein [Candidatus Acidoferrales bacterium]
MRYLILSDIHGNRGALDAALTAAEGAWDKAVCLGDIVGYGPDPNETTECVRSLGAISIRGNHDRAASGVTDAEDFNPIARQAVLWTRNRLRPENLEYLSTLPQGPVELDGFAIAHGAPQDEDEYVFAPEQARQVLREAPAAVTFCGHTHIQGGFALREGKMQTLHFRPSGGKPFAALRVEDGTEYLLNPGSVGQPRDGDARAAFAIADLALGKTVEFWRVSYDVASVQARMKSAGLPEPLISRLAAGR